MAPADIQNLAPELLDHILSYLFGEDEFHGVRPSIPDLLSVSCTSKRLRHHALPFIYRDIQFSSRWSQWRMKLLLRTLMSQSWLLEHTRTVCVDVTRQDNSELDRPWQGSQPFTPHDIKLLRSFMRRLGMEPKAFSRYFKSFGRQWYELSIHTAQLNSCNSESGPVSMALIFALLLTCSSSKPLDLRLVLCEVCGVDDFWEILEHLIQSEPAGGLRPVRQLSYSGYKVEQSVEVGILGAGGSGWGAVHDDDHPNQQLSYSHRSQRKLLFGISMESISLSTRCWDSLAPEFHAGVQSALTSMTLRIRGCETASLVSILRICPHLTRLNYIGVIHDFNPFDAETLGIALGHAPSLEHVSLCLEFTMSRRFLGLWDAPWLQGNIGALKKLVRLRTLEIPAHVLLGWCLDTPRLPLWDVFPGSLHELRLRDDGSHLPQNIFSWAHSLSPLSEYLDWRADDSNPSIGVALDQVFIQQRGRFNPDVVEALQQKCDRLGIKITFKYFGLSINSLLGGNSC
jgi:hypothetical protein